MKEEASIVSIWTLVRFVHVLSAMVWVGGQLLSLLVLPVLRRRLDAASRAPLTREVGVRLGIFTVAIFLPLQIATGTTLATHRGLTLADLAEPGYGRTLGEQVTLFAVVLLISGVHGVAVGRGQHRLARPLGLATLFGSVGVVLLPRPSSPQAREVAHAVVILLELAGAMSILAAFTLSQLRLLDQHSLVYLILNLVGSAVLAVIAFVDERWGFLLLEGVWSIVSAVSLLGILRRGQEGAGHS